MATGGACLRAWCAVGSGVRCGTRFRVRGGVFVPEGFSAGASVVRDDWSVPAWMLASGWHFAVGERGEPRLRACDRLEWMHEEERASRR